MFSLFFFVIQFKYKVPVRTVVSEHNQVDTVVQVPTQEGAH